MKGMKGISERGLLMTRWRRAGALADRPAPATSKAPAVVLLLPGPAREEPSREPFVAPTPAEAPAPAGETDPVVLLSAFEAELRAAVPEAMAQKLCMLLALPREAFEREPTEKTRTNLLQALDSVEDVLDAVLLAAPDTGGPAP